MADSDTLPPPFLERLDAKPKRLASLTNDDDTEETVIAGHVFAVARGLRPPATLQLLHPNGELMFALAYGHLPTVWGDVPGAILLEYPHFGSLIIAGKQLRLLLARLCEYRVTWIRQCTAEEAALLPTAVTRIERLHRYPSRERNAPSKDGHGS